MRNRWLGGFWAQLPLAATVSGVQAVALTADNGWIYLALALMWIVTVGRIARPDWDTTFGRPARWLRARPILWWFVLLALFTVGVGGWLVDDQPTNGRALRPAEVTYVLALLWLFLYIAAYGLGRDDARTLGAKLGTSRLAGPLLTLTTVVALFFSAEAYLRLFFITTEGYGFTAMNYHWYQNFYFGHFNTFGYRDHEPKPDAPGLTRVAVVGDSFAAGHGINNIDDTFPQVLERRLGAGYDVNLVAQSGWDTDVQEAWLNGYPKHPQIVVLSYYLNDIDYLLSDPAVNPDNNFTTPDDPNLSWFVLNFFVPNYIYYNLLQYTSTARTGRFGLTLVNAHLDDDLWATHADRLGRLVDWSRDHQARLVVLLWPMIASIEDSRPATARVRDFFAERGVQVVDMTDVLVGQDRAAMILSRWDAHPSIAAHHLAADALYPAVVGE